MRAPAYLDRVPPKYRRPARLCHVLNIECPSHRYVASARPVSDRHAQPDWIGGGSESRQTMHAHSCGSMPAEAIWDKWTRKMRKKWGIFMRRPLTAEQAATAAARAAADEAAATIRRLQLLLAAEKAAKAAKVFVPGYVIP